jgi:hypothetical protein
MAPWMSVAFQHLHFENKLCWRHCVCFGHVRAPMRFPEPVSLHSILSMPSKPSARAGRLVSERVERIGVSEHVGS